MPRVAFAEENILDIDPVFFPSGRLPDGRAPVGKSILLWLPLTCDSFDALQKRAHILSDRPPLQLVVSCPHTEEVQTEPLCR
jgi:hypothetical protein